METTWRQSPLFRGMTSYEIDEFARKSGLTVVSYDKNEAIFQMEDEPTYLFILLGGGVAVCEDSLLGKRMVVTTIDEVGDIFAEVYLFLQKNSYDYYAVAIKGNTKVLKIPKSIFQEEKTTYYHRLVENLLVILSQKAYNFSRKLQVLGSGSLRQKLIRLMLEGMDQKQQLRFGMNREELADYLNVARPSLSRELSKMEKEGLILAKGKHVQVLQKESMEQELG